MSREISERTGTGVAEIRRIALEELGLDDLEPVVLTFEISNDATEEEAAKLLAERSSVTAGLAAGIYRRVEEVVERS